MASENIWGKKQGLHYCSPAHGGWGVVRVAMLVPEIQVLFVCPSGCGRHGAIGAIETGHKRQVAYLCIDETDIVSGSYENMIPRAVDEMIARASDRPKAVFIFVSCLDDLLGTDYEVLIEELSRTHNMPFRICHMNPISLDSKLPPPVNVQRSIYSLLEKSATRTASINIIGAYKPLNKESELFKILVEAGIEKVNHISEFDSYEGFQTMSRATFNLITRPEGLLAAKDMEKDLGIPFCFLPVSYNLSTIDAQYKKLCEFTGINLDLSRERNRAEDKIKAALNLLRSVPISLDAGATCRPFDLARALIDYGFNVTDVFADKLPEFEVPASAWLKENVPAMNFHRSEYHSWMNNRREKDDNRLAIGFNSGYLSGAEKIVTLAFDEGMFGYAGVITLMDMMAEAYNNSQNLRKSIENYGLVV